MVAIICVTDILPNDVDAQGWQGWQGWRGWQGWLSLALHDFVR